MTKPSKVLILGSGPIVIGQAAEFDYSGTQACRALREEGVTTVLVNSNPATIMTDEETADVVYIEPLTVEVVERIIAREKPDGLLPTLGGQTGLNLAVAIADAGVLERHNVRLLGTPLETIRKAEDRELFKTLMAEIGEPVTDSETVTTQEQAEGLRERMGLPLVIRPAYTLGGTGGGVAHTPEQYAHFVQSGLAASPIHQVLIERSLLGWKEIEYEVMRDAATGAAERVGRPDHQRQADQFEDGLGLVHGRDGPALGDRLADLLEQALEQLAVLGGADRLDLGAEETDVVLVEHTGVGERDREVEAGLAAEGGQEAVRALPLDDPGQHLDRERLDVDDVGDALVGHDCRRVGVDEDGGDALLAQGAAGLGAGVVELRRLADDDRPAPDDEDLGGLVSQRTTSPPAPLHSVERGGGSRGEAPTTTTLVGLVTMATS